MNDFIEVQKFRKWWFWIPVFASMGFLGFVLYQQTKVPSSPMKELISQNLVIGTLILLIVCAVLFYFMKLETKITTEQIEVRLFPIQKNFRVYEWKHITNVEVRNYRPLIEYGGWGLRGFRNNRAINLYGNMGLQLTFDDESRLLIGTQKKDELKHILAERLNKENHQD